MLATAIAVCLLVVAGYVHWQLPEFIPDRAKLLATRLVLVVAGSTVGLCMGYAEREIPEAAVTLYFLGLGMLHVPAALILVAKRHQRIG